MTEHALILGGGMVGSMMALDLCRDPDFQVTLADRDPAALQRARERCGPELGTVEADLSDPAALTRLASEASVVLGALASRLGLGALRAVIEAERPYADISFMAEDARELDGFARERGVCAVVDCGVAPGMSNLLAAHACAQLDEVHTLRILVGGLPVERRLPYEYKAGFAPSDVIEEYTRPARVVENGRLAIREPLGDRELLDFEGVGTLEAFTSDGLRSLADTLPATNMIEKTLRYPGHAELMSRFRDAGLFSEEKIEVEGALVSPRALLSRLLFPRWTFEEGEEDLTVMRIQAIGMRGGEGIEERWELHDRYHHEDGMRSMSRSTALPCTLIARLLASGRFREPGVHPPERLGLDPELVNALLGGLATRQVIFRHRRLPAF